MTFLTKKIWTALCAFCLFVCCIVMFICLAFVVVAVVLLFVNLFVCLFVCLSGAFIFVFFYFFLLLLFFVWLSNQSPLIIDFVAFVLFIWFYSAVGPGSSTIGQSALCHFCFCHAKLAPRNQFTKQAHQQESCFLAASAWRP